MIRVLAILLAFVAPVAFAATEEVVGALSQNKVSITANFDGSEIFIFGAVKRTAPIPEDIGPLHVVITVQGPRQEVTVRRKERVLGIWVNTDSVTVDEAPAYYAIATTGPLTKILSETERLRHGIGFDKAIRTVGARADVEDPESFTEAVVRIRQKNGLYTEADSAINLREDTLFATSVALPANLVEGSYTTRMYLVRERAVVGTTETAITVQKDGFERWIYTMAHEQALLYGILSIAVALAAGYIASEAFRLLRR
ncbi:TIGR02186 family protein [Oceanibium sediminis]|uniref:TIGR02186 family protein n=1 Tax=Oceanibium sediminis TaxID=2026339 RepID=UPI000DD3E91C|nr:TIGR02186 family protein [Oceanibium sediminis]